MFCFYTETESFDVSIEPKQTEDQPKQFDREHILPFFTENLGYSRFFSSFFSDFFGLFRNSLSRSYSLKESIFGYFSKHLGLLLFVSVCYETVLFVSVDSI